MTGVKAPKTEIDGKDVWDLLSGKGDAINPHNYYAFSTNKNFESIMSADGKWKLHLPHEYRTLITPGKDGSSGKYKTMEMELSLYDMENDPYEANNVISTNSDIASELIEFADLHRQKYYVN